MSTTAQLVRYSGFDADGGYTEHGPLPHCMR